MHKVKKNLKSHLVRTSINTSRALRPGCFGCGEECVLDLVMEEGKEVYSHALKQTFTMKSRVTCKDTNVIYVITCKKCGIQGVGECGTPKIRLMSYFKAARDHEMPGNLECAIHRHFLREDHCLNDLQIQLVDKIPVGLHINPACIPAVRVRQEWRWVKRLGAVLNERKELHHSFPGAYNARRTSASQRVRRQASLQ